ncbi:DUF1223 domain-containing protein [Thioclava sp. GXIMD2076]|uniref:DUF1223 domain-containing protein n=1 Tax=Thioclava sp. GXIMD2076 TaxID=3131931 RepID=UPI0030CA787A
MTTAQVDHPAKRQQFRALPLRFALLFSLGAFAGAVCLSDPVWAQEGTPTDMMGGAQTPSVPPSLQDGLQQNDQAATGSATGSEDVASSRDIATLDTPDMRTPIVVELFTSQGCAACPPADKLLQGLAARDDVIALALHVDYWDYLGWKDPFGQPAFTSRQKGYARAVKERMIYTPQMIVNGQQRLLGADRMAIKSALDAATSKPSPVEISVAQDGANYRISLAAKTALGQDAMVQVVRYIPDASVDILRGENAGLTVNYANIVTQWHIVADWDGETPMSFDTQVEGDNPAVVIVQTSQPGRTVPLPGAIVGSARIK